MLSNDLQRSTSGDSVRHSVLHATPDTAHIAVAGDVEGHVPGMGGRILTVFSTFRDLPGAARDSLCDLEAIAQLEALRARGVRYLVITRSVVPWFATRAGFRRHLDIQYRCIVDDESACLIFAIGEREHGAIASLLETVEALADDFRWRDNRDPAILDWVDGVSLESLLPHRDVFSAPQETAALPYLDGSIDLIVTSAGDPLRQAECRRVAKTAVLTVTDAIDLEAPDDGSNRRSGDRLPVDLTWLATDQRRSMPSASIVIPVERDLPERSPVARALAETLPDHFTGDIILVAERQVRPQLPSNLERLFPRLKTVHATHGDRATIFAAAAGATENEFLIFLDEDLIPLSGWLAALLHTYRLYPDAAVVGGMLLSPEGALLRDGTPECSPAATLYPDHPAVNYVRSVDRVSVSFFSARRELFFAPGGLESDERAQPGRLLEQSARDRGGQVYYQPLAAAVLLSSQGDDVLALDSSRRT